MRRGLLAVTLLLVACGGQAGTEAGEGASPSPSPSPTVDTAAQQALYEECSEGMESFLTTLQELDSRLDVGLNVSEYGELVGDAKVAYDQVPFKTLPQECVARVGIPAERALRAYLQAYLKWNDCVGKLTCSTDKIEPQLQKAWQRAHGGIDAAARALERLQP